MECVTIRDDKKLYRAPKNNYVIDPKPGRFVNIPVTPEFEHMVEFVEGNDRHTFYGNSYTDKSYWRYSAPENC